MRELIVARKPAVIAAASIWDAKRANLLEADADAQVGERLSVPGTDPEIAAAVARCVEAHHANDMAALRLAVFEIEGRARAIAAQRQQERHAERDV